MLTIYMTRLKKNRYLRKFTCSIALVSSVLFTNLPVSAGQIFTQDEISVRAMSLKQMLSQLAEKGTKVDASVQQTLVATSGGLVTSDMKIYSADENLALRQFIDQAVLDLFEYSKVASQMCLLLGDRVQNYSFELGVSEQAAEKTFQICKKEYSSLPAQSFRMRFKSKIYFVFGLPKNFQVESWTTQSNDVFYFFPAIPSLENIYARIIHELYMAHDAKFLLGRETISSIAEATGAKVQVGFFQSTEKELHIPMGVYPMPLIKFTFATVRAMVFEYAILRDLFGQDISKKLSEYKILHQEADDVVITVGLSLLNLQDYLMPTEAIALGVRDRREYYTAKGYYIKDRSALQNIINNVYRKSSVTMYESDTNKTLSLTQWLTIPVVDGWQFFARGPKPRIGGGFNTDEGGDPDKQENANFSALEKIQNNLKSMSSKQLPSGEQ